MRVFSQSVYALKYTLILKQNSVYYLVNELCNLRNKGSLYIFIFVKYKKLPIDWCHNVSIVVTPLNN